MAELKSTERGLLIDIKELDQLPSLRSSLSVPPANIQAVTHPPSDAKGGGNVKRLLAAIRR